MRKENISTGLHLWIQNIYINSSEILKSKAKKINKKTTTKHWVSWNASADFPQYSFEIWKSLRIILMIAIQTPHTELCCELNGDNSDSRLQVSVVPVLYI